MSLAKTAGMSGKQYGDWFEGEVQKGLDQLMSEGPSFFARLYDTRSANSFLPKQAADFLGTHMGKGFSLEAKATVVYQSLDDPGAMRGLIKDHQALGAYLQGRAGGLGLFVFRSRVSQQLQIWDGHLLRAIYVTPRAKLTRTPLIVSCQCHDSEVVSNFKYMFNRTFQ